MSAHYSMNSQLSLASKLRNGLDSLQTSKHTLEDLLAAMQQMTAAQAATAFGFVDTDTATAAINELASDIGALTGITAALNQMFAQFAG